MEREPGLVALARRRLVKLAPSHLREGLSVGRGTCPDTDAREGCARVPKRRDPNKRHSDSMKDRVDGESIEITSSVLLVPASARQYRVAMPVVGFAATSASSSLMCYACAYRVALSSL